MILATSDNYRHDISTETPLEAHCPPMKTKVRDLRKAAGMTQIELSLAADVPQSTISHLENGSSNATLETLQKVSAALNIPPHLIFEASEEQTPVAQLVRLFARLNDAEQKVLLNTADVILAGRSKAP